MTYVHWEFEYLAAGAWYPAMDYNGQIERAESDQEARQRLPTLSGDYPYGGPPRHTEWRIVRVESQRIPVETQTIHPMDAAGVIRADRK